ncbi:MULTISPECIES: DUF2975 domain-containing protein [Paenibacillus]|nr:MULTISPECIES: DUF2975 domain-containing protein [Paenibacillus]ETT56019.1 hypothetical protein C170_00989 [Paenibacillus sp. FSL H7-689]OMF41607.1 hypothetical protein BK136_20525 [Paenibacillus amylolyticus]PJN48855.1 hypothetical protein PAEAM_57170 [Paenibacillus sp. GM1FR]PRA02136.1 DUF2975 domain-containing protein [Paenibacillus sp. MYb63]PRA45013.1 DUF2975 domain-containing protein [Paenibacillus sp. MYb67]
MKRGTTIFLKLAVLLIGVPILALCIFGIPWLANNPVNPNYAGALYPIVIIMYVSVIPFIVALYQAFRLLSYIDKNEAFSLMSVKSLKTIKYCAIVISSLYFVMLPFVYVVAEKDDAPGLILMGMVPVFASLVIAVFSAVLQRLLQEAIDIKSENDLVV